jgi:hypothetical protein
MQKRKQHVCKQKQKLKVVDVEEAVAVVITTVVAMQVDLVVLLKEEFLTAEDLLVVVDQDNAPIP